MDQPDPQAIADTFNARHIVGKAVRYYPVTGQASYRIRNTRTPAHVLSGHTAVVYLDGERGAVAVNNLKPTTPGEQAQ